MRNLTSLSPRGHRPAEGLVVVRWASAAQAWGVAGRVGHRADPFP